MQSRGLRSNAPSAVAQKAVAGSGLGGEAGE